MTAPSGGSQDSMCLRLDLFWGWLFKLELSRLAPKVRDLMTPFQRTGYEALHRHFTGQATSARPTGDLAAIAAQVDTLTRQLTRIKAGSIAEVRRQAPPRLLHIHVQTILSVIQESAGPLTPSQVTLRLHAAGRTDLSSSYGAAAQAGAQGSTYPCRPRHV